MALHGTNNVNVNKCKSDVMQTINKIARLTGYTVTYVTSLWKTCNVQIQKSTSIFFFILISASAQAQIQIQNGGMELWGGFNILRPDSWGTLEQALGVRTNKWVFEESMPDNVHKGTTSVRLVSDTVLRTYRDKPSQVRTRPGMIAYGKMGYTNDRLTTTGLPIYGRPVSLSFYIKIYHPQTDTASMRLVLTRWDPIRMQADTLAYEKRDVFPDSVLMDGFALFTDSITYLMDGEADTARIILSSGRPGDIKLRGNMVWIEDLSFDYPGGETGTEDSEEEVLINPNPAKTQFTIKADQNIVGYSVAIFDVTGIKVKETTIDEGTTRIDVADLESGTYCYAVYDRNKNKVHEGNINIMKDGLP